MSKKVSEKKELELRKLRAETDQAEYEAEQERIRLERQEQTHREEFDYSPARRGIFRFYAPVTAGNCSIFANEVQRYAHLNPPTEDGPGGPITIYIQTPGGYLLEGMGLYDTLRTLSRQGHHITTAVRGYAASMGMVLLQAGDLRLVGEESYTMFHEVAAGAIGKLHEMEDDVKRVRLFNKRAMDIVARRTDGKWDADSLYKWLKAKERWLSAEETVENGFADAVG